MYMYVLCLEMVSCPDPHAHLPGSGWLGTRLDSAQVKLVGVELSHTSWLDHLLGSLVVSYPGSPLRTRVIIDDLCTHKNKLGTKVIKLLCTREGEPGYGATCYVLAHVDWHDSMYMRKGLGI